jgi:hypothetical protein
MASNAVVASAFVLLFLRVCDAESFSVLFCVLRFLLLNYYNITFSSYSYSCSCSCACSFGIKTKIKFFCEAMFSLVIEYSSHLNLAKSCGRRAEEGGMQHDNARSMKGALRRAAQIKTGKKGEWAT